MNSKIRIIFGSKSRFLLATVLLIGSSSIYAGYSGIRPNQIDTVAGITVNQDLRYIRGARIYMQYGMIVGSVHQSAPYCYFRLHRNRNDLTLPVDVQASTFQITAIRNQGRQVRNIPWSGDGVKVANMGRDGGSANQMSLNTEFHLSSDTQPQVKKMVCAVSADPRDRGWVNFKEIQNTLGDLVSISQN